MALRNNQHTPAPYGYVYVYASHSKIGAAQLIEGTVQRKTHDTDAMYVPAQDGRGHGCSWHSPRRTSWLWACSTRWSTRSRRRSASTTRRTLTKTRSTTTRSSLWLSGRLSTAPWRCLPKSSATWRWTGATCTSVKRHKNKTRVLAIHCWPHL